MDDSMRQHDENWKSVKSPIKTSPVLFTLRDVRHTPTSDLSERDCMLDVETDSNNLKSARQAGVQLTDEVRSRSWQASVDVSRTTATRINQKKTPGTNWSTSDKPTKKRTRRQPLPRQSIWPRVVASLLVLILLGIAYLTFRGPVVVDPRDPLQEPFLDMADLDEREEDGRWPHPTVPVDVAQRRDAKPRINKKPAAEKSGSWPVEGPVPKLPPFSAKTTQETGNFIHVDEISQLDNTAEVIASPPRWKGPTNRRIEWREESHDKKPRGYILPSESTIYSPPDQPNVSPGPTRKGVEPILDGVSYRTNGNDVKSPTEAVPFNEERFNKSSELRIAADPGAARSRQYGGKMSGFRKMQRGKSTLESPRLRGTIKSSYMGRTYEPGRSGLY